MRFPTRLSKNLEYENDGSLPRYFLSVDLSEVTDGRNATLPVYWRSNGLHPILKEIYTAEVGGIRIEKGNLQSLAEAVHDAVAALTARKALPYYSIALPGSTKIPVFLVGDQLRVEYGAIRLASEDISDLCQKMSKKLILTKEIRRKEDLRISIFLWADLRLYPAAFIVRDSRGRIWFPIFMHVGRVGSALNFDLPNRPSKIFKTAELPLLLGEVSRHLSLTESKAIHQRVFLDLVRDDFWAELRKALRKEDVCLRYESLGQKREISVYSASGLLIAADKPRIYFGVDQGELRDVVAESLREERLVPSATSISIERRRN